MGKVFRDFPMIKRNANSARKSPETTDPVITPEYSLCCEDF
jgi:hypothetical protein